MIFVCHFQLRTLYDSMIPSQGSAAGVPAGRGKYCAGSQPPTCHVVVPQSLCEGKQGPSTSMEIFASLPPVLAQNTTKLHHFITVDISITILSCNC